MSVKSFNGSNYSNHYPRLEQHVKTKGWSIRPGLKLVSLREDLAFKVWPNKKKRTFYIPPGNQVAFPGSNTYPEHVSLTKSNAKTNFVIHYEEEEDDFANEYFVDSDEENEKESETVLPLENLANNNLNINNDQSINDNAYCTFKQPLISVLKKPGNTNPVKKKVAFSDNLEVEETDCEEMSTSASSN